MPANFISVLALLLVALVAGSFARRLRRDRKLTQPLASIAGLYGRFLILYLVLVFLGRGFASGGLRGSVCVDTGRTYGVAAKGFAARPGASLSLAGDVRACALHPSIWQWGLFLLTKLPGLALWGLPAAADLAPDQAGEQHRPVHGKGRCRHAAAWLGRHRRQHDCCRAQSPRR
jgi:hypothetical protein